MKCPLRNVARKRNALNAAGGLPVRVKSPVNGGQDCIELFEVFGTIDVQVAPVTFFIHRSNLLAARGCTSVLDLPKAVSSGAR